MNLDYSVLEVAMGAEVSWDHPGISWPVNLDYSILEVARGSSQYHPRILCFLDFTKTFSDN